MTEVLTIIGGTVGLLIAIIFLLCYRKKSVVT